LFKEQVVKLFVKVRVHHFVVTLDWIVTVCGLSFGVFFIYVLIKVLCTIAKMRMLGWGWTGQGDSGEGVLENSIVG